MRSVISSDMRGLFSWFDYIIFLILVFGLTLFHEIHQTLKVVVKRGLANEVEHDVAVLIVVSQRVVEHGDRYLFH